jgi:hypothetical protein
MKTHIKMKHTYACIAERTEMDLIWNYLDYFNNYLTVSAFAQAYGLKPYEALLCIEKGRELNEAIAKTEGVK